MPKQDPIVDEVTIHVIGDDPLSAAGAEVAGTIIRAMRDSGHPMETAVSGCCSALGAVLGGYLARYEDIDDAITEMAKAIRMNARINWIRHNAEGARD
jgi:hypothetical protein